MPMPTLFCMPFLGWVCEDLYCGIPAKKFINRGFFYGPYCPIYGVGALLVLYPLLFVKDYPILVFILGVIITSTLEYITSWVMEILFKTRWWDYSKRFMNINGRVCLLNSTLFGIMSIVVVYIIHPVIQDIVLDIPLTALMSFCQPLRLVLVLTVYLQCLPYFAARKYSKRCKHKWKLSKGFRSRKSIACSRSARSFPRMDVVSS